MSIIITLDRVIKDRDIPLTDLAGKVGINYVNLSRIKNNKVRFIRLSTLEKICDALDCQPGDILEFKRDE